MNRLLVVGCGDVARRAMPWLAQHFALYALVRRESAAAEVRRLGAIPIHADLDDLCSLHRIAGIADIVVHCAPPQDSGRDDLRTRRLIAALGTGKSLARRIVYISTTGVYGDCHGERVSESRPLKATTARAQRRVAAEGRLRAWSARTGAALVILRAPGIYAAERLPLERLRRRDPVLNAAEDVVTNHIHADDLARALCRAVFFGGGGRSFNVCDDSRLAMGDYYDLVADVFGLERPPRMSRDECTRHLSPATLSFMSESRSLENDRIKRELRFKLAYPDVALGLQAIRATKNSLEV